MYIFHDPFLKENCLVYALSLLPFLWAGIGIELRNTDVIPLSPVYPYLSDQHQRDDGV